jgi:hypothetical protein
VYSSKAVDAAVDSSANFILQAIDLAILRGVIRKSRFRHWFSHSLIYYIRKNNYFYRRYKKSKKEYYYSKFFHYRKFVKITIKCDRLYWFKKIEDDLKTQPTKVWRYGSSFANIIRIMFNVM